MKNVTAGISPFLIQVLGTGLGLEPDHTDVFIRFKNIRKALKKGADIVPIISPNKQMLRCKECGRRGKYDIGMMYFNSNNITRK